MFCVNVCTLQGAKQSYHFISIKLFTKMLPGTLEKVNYSISQYTMVFCFLSNGK